MAMTMRREVQPVDGEGAPKASFLRREAAARDLAKAADAFLKERGFNIRTGEKLGRSAEVDEGQDTLVPLSFAPTEEDAWAKHDEGDPLEDVEGVDVFVPFGDALDIAEARMVGMHVGTSAVMGTLGDGYLNVNNGARHSSMMGGVMRAGTDIDAFEGMNAFQP